MRNRIMILAGPLTAEEEAAITEYIKQHYGWWHWIPCVWFVATRKDPNVTDIRDAVHTLAPKARVLVFKNEFNGWAGHGPNSEERNMFKWLRRNWKRVDDDAPEE